MPQRWAFAIILGSSASCFPGSSPPASTPMTQSVFLSGATTDFWPACDIASVQRMGDYGGIDTPPAKAAFGHTPQVEWGRFGNRGEAIQVAAGAQHRVRQKSSSVRQETDDSDRMSFLRATRVTLHGTMPFHEAIESLAKQAGVEIVGAERVVEDVELDIQGEEFWRAADLIFTPRGFRFYPYDSPGTRSLRVVESTGRGLQLAEPIVCYDGPFRIEALRCESTMDFVNPAVDQLRVVLGLQWEPRLKPIAFQQRMNEVRAIGEPGELPIGPLNAASTVESAVTLDSHFTEMSLPFELPGPETGQIGKLSGTIHALIPGPVKKFEFENLDDATRAELHQQDLTVRLEGWTVEHGVYALNLRLVFERDHGALDSFRSWIARNAIELNDGMGTSYKPLRMDVVKQSGGEVALRYYFPRDPASMNLEYWSAAEIFDVPIALDLRRVDLP